MKLTGVKCLDIASTLGKTKNKITLVGVELEGGWADMPSGIPLEHDGSVFRNAVPPGVKVKGELPLGPTIPGGIERLMRTYYPDVVDKSCGMHVHMSFENSWHYGLLMIPEYTVTMIEYLKRWAKETGFKDTHYIWARLRGESPFCKLEFIADAQIKIKSKSHDMNIAGNRYTAVHYCGRLQPPTIEIRVLPMMGKRSVAISAVKEVMRITNACIFELGKNCKRNPNSEAIELPNNSIYRETIIDIV